MIHHVYANRSNIGDWGSALGIQRLLGTPVKDHFCDRPFVRGTLKALAGTAPDDLIVIGGGGLFMDYFAPFWEGLVALKPAAPVFVWGAGMCDLKAEATRPDRDLIRRVADLATAMFVRDELTRTFIGLAGLPAPTVCPALAAIDPEPQGWGILHVDNYTTAGAAAFERMDAVARSFADRSGRPYRRTNNRIEGRPTRDGFEELLSRYRSSDVVLSSALHGCIFAVGLGRPVVAVSGDWKIEAFMQSVGLGDWVLRQEDVARVPALLERIGSQPDPRAAVDASIAANRAIAARVVRHHRRHAPDVAPQPATY